MFDQVAPRYDRTNLILSLGNDRWWRRATVRAIDPLPGQRILDLAAGTGASAAPLARRGAHVVAADFSAGMIEEGRRRHAATPGLSFVTADATALPFEDESFDAVTISFGLRNVSDPHLALREMRRVARPGGLLMVCEFSHPTNAALANLYGFYNAAVMPALARAVSSDPEAYRYLNETIREWPDQRTLAAWIADAGWSAVAHRDLTGGIVALHRARRPLE